MKLTEGKIAQVKRMFANCPWVSNVNVAARCGVGSWTVSKLRAAEFGVRETGHPKEEGEIFFTAAELARLDQFLWAKEGGPGEPRTPTFSSAPRHVLGRKSISLMAIQGKFQMLVA